MDVLSVFFQPGAHVAERASFDVVFRAVVPVRALDRLILIIFEDAVPECECVFAASTKVEQHVPEHAVFKRQATVHAEHQLHQHRVFAFWFEHHVLDDGVHVVVHLRVVVPVEQIPLAARLAVTGRRCVVVGQSQNLLSAAISSSRIDRIEKLPVSGIARHAKNICIAVRNAAANSSKFLLQI